MTLLQEDRGGINISNVDGEVSGISLGGTGNITGKYVNVGSGTIYASEQRLAKIPNEYAESLKSLSENINKALKDRQISQEQVKSINQSIDQLAKEVEDIKPGSGQGIDPEKQLMIEAKTTGVIQRVLDALPSAAETVATFTPLAPFSKLIGKGVQEIVNAVQQRRNKTA